MRDRQVLLINGSYRKDGFTDRVLHEMIGVFEQSGIAHETVVLRDWPIAFCQNCRQCMQNPGENPGSCTIDDTMGELVRKIERSEGFVLASPTNFYTVTALFKRFLERLSVYGYWPWGKPAPVFRKRGLKKQAILISSCAAPGVIGTLFYSTMRILKVCAKTVGAKTVGTKLFGLVGTEPGPVLGPRQKKRARKLALKLVQNLSAAS